MTLALGFHSPDDPVALAQLGQSVAIINDFIGWDKPYPANMVTGATKMGAKAMVTWQPNTTTLTDIVAGKQDAYITSWAQAAKAGPPILIRLAHEMNGRWYPWGYGNTVNTANTPALYVAMWRRVVGIFRAQGATNVEWVWCAATGGPGPLADLFPGDAYVDYVSLDGYNRQTKGVWRTIADIFTTDYDIITALSAKPVLIAETASVEDPADPTAKATWITEGFASILTAFPRVAIACYFNSSVHGHDYQWDSTPQALAAIRGAFKPVAA